MCSNKANIICILVFSFITINILMYSSFINAIHIRELKLIIMQLRPKLDDLSEN